MKKSEQRKLIKSRLIPFQTILLKYQKASKEKFVVLVCDNPALCFFINSDVNPNYINNKYVQDFLIPIYHEQLPCLNSGKPSFIHCGDVINYFSTNEIINQLIVDYSRLKGQIDSSIWPLIIKMVKKIEKLIPFKKD